MENPPDDSDPQEGPESILLNKTRRNSLVQRAAALLRLYVVANLCRSYLTVGDIITKLSSLVAMGIIGSQKNKDEGASGA